MFPYNGPIQTKEHQETQMDETRDFAADIRTAVTEIGSFYLACSFFTALSYVFIPSSPSTIQPPPPVPQIQQKAEVAPPVTAKLQHTPT